MALNTVKLGDFVQNTFKVLNDNFSDLESRKANTTDIPTKVSSLENDSGFATTSYVDGKISTVFRYKGTLSTEAELPSSNNAVGDVYFVTEHGCEWAWQGSQWVELGTAVDLTGYVEKEEGKGLSQNDYTTAEKQKLAGLENYTLPIAGVALGGVKNGGNVTVNADGTMTASTSDVERMNFTADDPRWGDAQGGVYTLTAPSDKHPLAVYRKESAGAYCLALAGVTVDSGNLLLTSLDRFEGYVVVI